MRRIRWRETDPIWYNWWCKHQTKCRLFSVQTFIFALFHQWWTHSFLLFSRIKLTTV